MASAAAMTGQETARYTSVAVALHWIIALLLLGNLFLGMGHEWFGKAFEARLMFFHKAIGISVLLLTLARLAWRLTHRPPLHDATLKRWEAGLAGVIHAAFYVALIAIPLTGWMYSSTYGRPTSFFGLFAIPPLPVPRGEDAGDLFEEAHGLLAWLTLGLVGLHVAGALKHHFQGHRHMIGRMAPWLQRGR